MSETTNNCDLQHAKKRLCFRLAEDLDPGDEPYDIDKAATVLEAVLPMTYAEADAEMENFKSAKPIKPSLIGEFKAAMNCDTLEEALRKGVEATAAKDRAERERDSLRMENEQLISLGRKQRDEIETLGYMADAVERLRDIGNLIGCDHIDDPDGRLKLVSCVDSNLCDIESKLAAAEEANRGLREGIAKAIEIFQTSDDERLKETYDAAEEAEHWKSEGDMYGWNFHMGKSGGITAASIYFYRVKRYLAALLAPAGEEGKDAR